MEQLLQQARTRQIGNHVNSRPEKLRSVAAAGLHAGLNASLSLNQHSTAASCLQTSRLPQRWQQKQQHAYQQEQYCLQEQKQRSRIQPRAANAINPGSSSDAWQASSTGVLRVPKVSLWSLGGPLAWTYMLGYLALMLILPISALLAKASLVPLSEFIARAAEPVALSAYYVSFSMAIVAGAINAVFGFLLAWVLVKFEFPGKKWVDAAVDLPFALPTSVAGLTLATIYSEEGVLGALLTKLGVNVVYTRLGVAVAMVFVSFPFVVRTMQPVLQEMEKEVEEAAWSLGASPWTTFTQVLLPPLLPPLLTGTALAFSRALGEFGSIVIVSSNFPFKDLIAPVLIFQCLEQYDFVGATVIGTVLLLISLVMMVGVNWLQSYTQRFNK